MEQARCAVNIPLLVDLTAPPLPFRMVPRLLALDDRGGEQQARQQPRGPHAHCLSQCVVTAHRRRLHCLARRVERRKMRRERGRFSDAREEVSRKKKKRRRGLTRPRLEKSRRGKIRLGRRHNAESSRPSPTVLVLRRYR